MFTALAAGAVTDWLVMCWKNPGTAPRNILSQGVRVGRLNTSLTANFPLELNRRGGPDASSWAAAHAIVWNHALTDTEMEQVSTAMLDSLTRPVDISTLNATCQCSLALAACNGSSPASQLPCPACTRCGAGTYTSPMCGIGCLACPYGTFSTSAGASSCERCPAGSYSMVAGARTCLACLGGKYSLVGTSSCLDVSDHQLCP
jgi:hypothetical protein